MYIQTFFADLKYTSGCSYTPSICTASVYQQFTIFQIKNTTGSTFGYAFVRTYSPLTLAYIGDGVYELVIRTILVKKGNCPVNQLHRKASSLVKAGTQSSMMEVIEPMLTEEEHSVYRRGRNAHSPTMAKHATMADYRRATGFEALMGYLYLKDDFSRIIELVRAGIGEDKI